MHPDRGRCEGVGGWEEECAPILTIFIGSFGWASDDIVPPVRSDLVSLEIKEERLRVGEVEGREGTGG